MKLNPTDIAGLKPQPKPFKISDGGGLYLYVTPSGGKLWRYDYNFNGKRKTLSLGAMPAVSLDDAHTAWRVRSGAVDALQSDHQAGSLLHAYTGSRSNAV